jgi:hypothetical protein
MLLELTEPDKIDPFIDQPTCIQFQSLDWKDVQDNGLAQRFAMS